MTFKGPFYPKLFPGSVITQLVTFHLVRNIKPIPWNKLLVQFHMSAGAKHPFTIRWKKTDSSATTETRPKIIRQRLGLGLAQCLAVNYIHATGLSGLSHVALTIYSYSDLVSSSIYLLFFLKYLQNTNTITIRRFLVITCLAPRSFISLA